MTKNLRIKNRIAREWAKINKLEKAIHRLKEKRFSLLCKVTSLRLRITYGHFI